jgi:hypothetical protein
MSKRRAPQRPSRHLSRTIPAALHDATLARSKELNPDTAKPYTAAEVAAWLREQHKCNASARAVFRLRATEGKWSEAQFAAALREDLRELVGPLIAQVRRSSNVLGTLTRKTRSTKDAAAALSAHARALKGVAELAGIAAPTQVDLTSGGQPLTFYLPTKRDDDGADG